MTTKYRHISTQEDVTFPLKITLSQFGGEAVPNDVYTFSRDFMTRATAQQLLDAGIEPYEHTKPTVTPSTNPIDYELNPVQFFAMLEILGKTDAVEAAIDAMPDVTQKAVARAKFKHSALFRRGDDLFVSLAPAVGLTPDAIDKAWMLAKDIA